MHEKCTVCNQVSGVLAEDGSQKMFRTNVPESLKKQKRIWVLRNSGSEKCPAVVALTEMNQNKYCEPKFVHSGEACHPCAGAMLIFSVSFQF